MGKPMSIAMGMGSQWSAGDAGAQPENTVRLLQNILPRPNRFPSRAPFAYDGLMAVSGLANLDDLVNNRVRLVALDTSQNAYTKSATAGSETWGGANATKVGGTRLSSSASYRGVSYYAFANGSGVPDGFTSFDGVTLLNNPVGSSINPRAVCIYGERLYLSSPRVVISNQLSTFSLTKPYDWSTWTLTNCTSQIISEGVTKTCRVSPTTTTGAAAVATPSSFAYLGQQKVTWMQHLRGVSATYAMPFTMEVVAVLDWASGSFSVGDIIVDNNENWQKCTVAGTTGGSAPSWNTALNGTTADGGVTWTNGGSAVMGSLQSTVPVADPTGLWSTYLLTAAIPPLNGTTITIHYRFKFGNTLTPTIQLVPIDVSYRDGLTDGDRAKSNRGAQVTGGDFVFPFFNVEASGTATIDQDAELWSEVGLPTTISAANTYRLTAAGATGMATNACVISNRKLTFKRSAFWQFMQTGDPDTPIRLEHLNSVTGCVGPLALDVWNDTAFFISEYEIFSYNAGANPTPLLGDGMREEVMNRGADWVESQSTYNRPILRIDQSKLIVWVYTQRAKLYAYDLRTQSWSTHLVGDGTIEVDCMEWNRNTGNFYVSFGAHGLTRMAYTTIARDVIDDTATQYDVDCTVIFKPIELYSPPRYDYSLQQVRFMHGATEDQTEQTTTAAYSFDQGKTFAKSATITLAPLSANGDYVPLRFVARQGRATITVKLSHVGKTGETRSDDGSTVQSAWALSPRSYADVIVRREERVRTNPAAGASNL